MKHLKLDHLNERNLELHLQYETQIPFPTDIVEYMFQAFLDLIEILTDNYFPLPIPSERFRQQSPHKVIKTLNRVLH